MKKFKKNVMPEVKCFDETEAKKELKKCPKIVRDYVKLLEKHNNRWKELVSKATGKIREQSNQIIFLTSENCSYCEGKGFLWYKINANAWGKSVCSCQEPEKQGESVTVPLPSTTEAEKVINHFQKWCYERREQENFVIALNYSGAWINHLKDSTPETKEDWYCPVCKSFVSGESVTFEEYHDLCGTYIGK